MAAIIVLAGAMTVLALRSNAPRDAATTTAPVAASNAEPPLSGPPAAKSHGAVLTEPKTTLVIYLYSTDSEYELAMQAEDEAAYEAESAYTAVLHRFLALKAATPEEELAARDTMFAALLTNKDVDEVILQDLRNA